MLCTAELVGDAEERTEQSQDRAMFAYFNYDPETFIDWLRKGFRGVLGAHFRLSSKGKGKLMSQNDFLPAGKSTSFDDEIVRLVLTPGDRLTLHNPFQVTLALKFIRSIFL